MVDPATIIEILPILYAMIVVIVIWDSIWKGISLWHAAQNNQLAWFICLIVFNTVGILPIIYLLAFQKKQKPRTKRFK